MLKVIQSTALAVLFVLLFSFNISASDILLVNSENPLPKNFVPCELIDIKSTRPDGRAAQRISLRLEQLFWLLRSLFWGLQ